MSVLTQVMQRQRADDPLVAEVSRLLAERVAVREVHERQHREMVYMRGLLKSLETAREQALTRARNLRDAARQADLASRRIVVCRDGTRVIFPTHPALVVSKVRRKR